MMNRPLKKRQGRGLSAQRDSLHSVGHKRPAQMEEKENSKHSKRKTSGTIGEGADLDTVTAMNDGKTSKLARVLFTTPQGGDRGSQIHHHQPHQHEQAPQRKTAANLALANDFQQEGEEEEGEDPLPPVRSVSETPMDIDALPYLDRAIFNSVYVERTYREILSSREAAFSVQTYLHRSSRLGFGAVQRDRVVEEMVDFSVKAQLRMETRYLAVSVLDRYLDFKSRPVLSFSSSSSSFSASFSRQGANFNRPTSDVEILKGVSRMTEASLSLLACASVLIACKFEESYHKTIHTTALIVKRAMALGAPSKKALFELEMEVLRVVRFDVNVPTIQTFLVRYVRAAELSQQAEVCVASLLADRCLTDYALIRFLPSVQAAAIVSITRQVVSGRSAWTSTLSRYTFLALADIGPCVQALQRSLLNEEAQRAVRLTLGSGGGGGRITGDLLRGIYSDQLYSQLVTLPVPAAALVTPATNFSAVRQV